MTHREAIKEWLSIIHLKNIHVIDWGSGAKPVMRYIKHEDCTFTTIDKNVLIDRERRAPDHITHDISSPITIPKADVAFCIEVLEHSPFTENILTNIANNLVSGGTLYLTMPYDFPVHSEDDYVRYTENGLRFWLRHCGFSVRTLQYTDNKQGYLVEATRA